MPLAGVSLTEERARSHLGDQAVLAALQQAIPDEAIDAVIAETGTQERRKRRLPARLVVAFVLVLGLWAREGLVAVLCNLVDGLREQDPSPLRRVGLAPGPGPLDPGSVVVQGQEEPGATRQ